MTRHRSDDFHSGRGYGADEASRHGLLGWLRKQFDKLLRAGGGPAPATILFTHALDEQLSGATSGERERRRKSLPHTTPFDEQRR
jgi:hypothetical protein